MKLVVDASVACKWFWDEPLSAEARRLATAAIDFAAPDMILAECANVAWRRIRRDEIPRAQAQAFLKALPRWFDSLAPSVTLHEAAFTMGCELEHPVYDCLYLALADREQTRVVTADLTFFNRVVDSPWKHRIESLGHT